VFFVISGFCIATLCDKLRRGPRPARTFLARRFRRIYPTFWVYLLLSMLIVPLVRPLGWMDGAEALTFRFFDFSSLSPWRWFGNVTLTGNWSESFGLGPGLFFGPDERAALFFGHLWTLTVEVQFYLICGLVLLLAPRRFFAAIAVLTAVFLARMGAHLILPDRNWMCFAVGCLLYCQLVYFSPRLRGWTTAAFLVCGVVVLAAQEMGVGLAPRLPVSPTSLLFAALLGVLRPFDRSLAEARALAPLMRLGRISYSVYLWHMLTCWLVLVGLERFVGAGAGTALLIKLPCMAGASILVGWGFHWAVESRFASGAAAAPGLDRVGAASWRAWAWAWAVCHPVAVAGCLAHADSRNARIAGASAGSRLGA
jgi:peptidoglycan/LPS O-acetylase OafA/YrhL